ncbi:hypothetical protein RND81_04G158700 [Saponaria officinalis]|uniref:Uncharacterized protein n=1 Tax=Saponaria officinalis TaxID=3572 RepID=A0AAW1LMH4_SAPOF
MNPLTLVRRTQNINAKEAELGISDEASWHANYKDSAYVFVGGLPYDLTEGDLLAVFAQYGEIVDVNLVREKSTGKSKGFAFIAYEDQRSTTLAVDNLNGAQIAGRTIRVDHVANYKKKQEEDEETERQKREERGVCRAFQRGECKYGDSCRFSHDEQRAANTGWGPEEERRLKAAHNKFDNLSGDNKRSREPPPSHASNRSSSIKKMTEDRKQYRAGSGDQDIGDRPKRLEHKEDRDNRYTERRSSRYEPELKKFRDSNGREESETRRRDTKSSSRDIREERDRDRDRDRSKDRGRDIDKETRVRDTDREKQSSRTRDHSSQHRRELEDDDRRQGGRDDYYHKSRR